MNTIGRNTKNSNELKSIKPLLLFETSTSASFQTVLPWIPPCEVALYIISFIPLPYYGYLSVQRNNIIFKINIFLRRIFILSVQNYHILLFYSYVYGFPVVKTEQAVIAKTAMLIQFWRGKGAKLYKGLQYGFHRILTLRVVIELPFRNEYVYVSLRIRYRWLMNTLSLGDEYVMYKHSI